MGGERLPARIERGEDRIRRLKRIGAAVGDGRVRLLALNDHFEMQTAIVGIDDRIRKAGSDHVVRLGQAFVE